VSQTLDAVLAKGQTMPERNRFPAVLQPHLYESHPNDSQVTGPVEQCPTVAARGGTGGNNTPLVQQPMAFSISPGVNRGKQTTDDLFVAQQETSRTLDTQGANPERHQGGTVIVQQPMAIPLQDCRDVDKNQNGLGIGNQGDPAYTLDRMATQGVAVAFAQNTRDEVRLIGGDGQTVGALAAQPGVKQTAYLATEITGTLSSRSSAGGGLGTDFELAGGLQPTPTMAVRRLTPVECERLQGFPDGWTDIEPGGKDTPDSPRYKALGNSMAVPVMAWIGRRINMAVQ